MDLHSNGSRLNCAVLIFVLVLVPIISGSFFRTSVAFSSGENASVVLGQSNFTSSVSGGNASGLFGPEAISVDSKGNVWISDSENNRVLEFTTPITNGENASVVLGQENFTSYYCSNPTLANLCDPQGLAFDRSGDLFVSDNSNNRILEFKSPFSNGESAVLSIGESSNGTTQSSLNSPLGLAFDSSGDLWVADEGNNRVLEFKSPLVSNESAALEIGQPDFVSNSSQSATLDSPDALAFDHTGDLWVTDSGNHRVLEFPSPVTMGENATIVIGQANFSSFSTSLSQSVIPSPYGIAFDSSGNLWVADTYDGRVLQFSPSFSDGENASLILGQTSYNASVSSPTQSLLVGPEAIAFDPSGNIWVLDSSENRALEFTVSGAVSSQTSSTLSSSSGTTSSTTAFSTSATSSSSFSTIASSSTLSSSTAVASATASTSSETTHVTTTSSSATSLSSSYLAVVSIVLFFSALMAIAIQRRKGDRMDRIG